MQHFVLLQCHKSLFQQRPFLRPAGKENLSVRLAALVEDLEAAGALKIKCKDGQVLMTQSSAVLQN